VYPNDLIQLQVAEPGVYNFQISATDPNCAILDPPAAIQACTNGIHFAYITANYPIFQVFDPLADPVPDYVAWSNIVGVPLTDNELTGFNGTYTHTQVRIAYDGVGETTVDLQYEARNNFGTPISSGVSHLIFEIDGNGPPFMGGGSGGKRQVQTNSGSMTVGAQSIWTSLPIYLTDDSTIQVMSLTVTASGGAKAKLGDTETDDETPLVLMYSTDALKGLLLHAEYQGPDGSTITFVANDMGNNFVPPNPALAKSFTLTVTLSALTTLNNAAGALGLGLIGVTSAGSMAVFGVYKVMKKRRMLDENADPWENDDIFDATNDNPLFSGLPQSTPIYDSE
jgi:hypothetical protein